jgi:flavodoxin
MYDIQQKALQQALAKLTILGCKFAVIAPDGVKYGDLTVVQEKEVKRKGPVFPRGELKDYIAPFLSNMQPGDVACVPPGKFGLENVQGSVAAYFNHHYGKQTHTSTINRVKNYIEVLRLA